MFHIKLFLPLTLLCIFMKSCGSSQFHLQHYYARVPGQCDGGEARHSQYFRIQSHNDGCQTFSPRLGPDQCIHIINKECSYDFFSAGHCRGESVTPNTGQTIGSVKVSACNPFRWGGGGWKKGKHLHQHVHKIFKNHKRRRPFDRVKINEFENDYKPDQEEWIWQK